MNMYQEFKRQKSLSTTTRTNIFDQFILDFIYNVVKNMTNMPT